MLADETGNESETAGDLTIGQGAAPVSAEADSSDAGKQDRAGIGTSGLFLSGHPLLEFQPAVDLLSGKLLGFEALLRWEHPTEGLIPPSLLIPWAEANGDIVALGSWVLAKACEEAQRWPSNMQIGVNCSIVQFRQGAIAALVAKTLETTGLNPDRLTMEVTEHTLSEESIAHELKAIRTLGVHLAIDDVGTSWSSLESLKRHQIDMVKVDRAFVSGLEARQGINRSIVEAVVNLSHSVSMNTVAEGVETARQVAVLRELGADAAQGFFFARPMAAEHATALACESPVRRFSLDGQTEQASH
jgi:EAL domain-containing protein (putative c-di-GMP-specific phosphodiesterase class I)